MDVNSKEEIFFNSDNVVIPKDYKTEKNYAFLGKGMKSIEFLDGITFIGDFAFSSCSFLHTIIFPNTLKDVNGKTLSNAPLLSKIDFRDDSSFSFKERYIFNKKTNEIKAILQSFKGKFLVPPFIKKIASYAFYDCKNITNIVLNEGLEEISEYSFCKTPIVRIEIPKSVKLISPYAFEECNTLKEIKVHKDNPYYKTISGVLYSKDETSLVCVPKGKDDILTMPDSVTKIYSDAFYHSNLRSITLSKNLTKTIEVDEEKSMRGLFEGSKIQNITPRNPKFKISFEMFNCHSESKYYTPLTTSSLKQFFFLLPCFYPSQLTPYYQKEALGMNLRSLIKKEGNNKEWEKEWYKYIKENASKYFDNILKDEDFFSLVLKEKLLSLKDTKKLIEITTEKKLLEKSSKLLSYQNETFSIDDIVNNKMKELNDSS